MKKKKSLLLFLAATSASFVQAALPVHTSFAAGIENVQEKGHTFIKGRVIDSEGNPLVGVTVQIEGTSYGVITDADGNYILEFPSMAHPKIVFSSIGYKSKSIEFRGVKEQNMMLELDHVALDDLVVIGYGSKSRRNVTTAISTVSQEQISKLAATTPTLDGLLQGTVKGVLATTANGEPGSSLKLNIRGITSPYPKSGKGNNNQPLYVIDGVPTFMEDTGINPLINISPNDIESIDVLKDAAATAIYGSRGANGVVIVKTKNGGIENINPQDIESIEVLKDASATAIYGARGANGVVLVTTKKGKEGGLKVNFNTTNSMQTRAQMVDMLSHDDFVNVINQFGTDNQKSLLGNANTDWNDEVYRTAFGTDNNLSLSGSIGKYLPFRVSAGYYNQSAGSRHLQVEGRQQECSQQECVYHQDGSKWYQP